MNGSKYKTLTVAVIFSIAWFFIPGTQKMENFIWDFHLSQFDDIPADSNIIVIGIDEASLNELGWPIDRKYYITLIEELNRYQPTAILFDLLFTDPSSVPLHDSLFSYSSKMHKNVIHAMYFSDSHSTEPSLSVMKKHSLPDSSTRPRQIQVGAGVLPFDQLKYSTNILGHINVQPDADGIYRRIPLVLHSSDKAFPAISLMAYNLAINSNRKPWINNKNQLRVNHLKGLTVPTDHNFTLLLRFSNKIKTISILEFMQMVKNKDPFLETFRNNIILIGNIAASLGDYGAIPGNSSLPKVLLHANAINTMIQNAYLRTLPIHFQFGITFVLLLIFWKYFQLGQPRHLLSLTIGTLILPQVIFIGIFKSGWMYNSAQTSFSIIIFLLVSKIIYEKPQ